ncbi:1-acyl-sn-glycerol-3-phosphate acyltransferase [Kineococcus xinjiangensis]|uniref:1-acyl-sn-glycerol-3-phosphate acyltransferase n=1 Tax=Kineococcus xinjiangensis TaxID=512762 RepID=A0A2S6IUS4_9ACTN|nr:lysophospholipid acyltransferase family protein [Kineococcus xinjiangensis]PPK97958.1 1-acyl-sn-glycerol-3-phosphate acyltransferase [Kineococcus xinjiangensis]
MTLLMSTSRPSRWLSGLLRRPGAGGSPSPGGAAGSPGGSPERGMHSNDWVRSGPATLLRSALQRGLLIPVLRAELRTEVHGADVFDRIDGPAVIVANHSSHLDTAVLLQALPPKRRRRTAAAAAADYFFDVWWRAVPSGLVIGAFPLERRGGVSSIPSELVRQGWSLLWFPEGGRSYDGKLRQFKKGAPYIALENDVPIVPVALRGTHEAMPPKKRNWPAPGRPRVTVHFGEPLRGLPGEKAAAFTARVQDAVVKLLADAEAADQAAGAQVGPRPEGAPRRALLRRRPR